MEQITAVSSTVIIDCHCSLVLSHQLVYYPRGFVDFQDWVVGIDSVLHLDWHQVNLTATSTSFAEITGTSTFIA